MARLTAEHRFLTSIERVQDWHMAAQNGQIGLLAELGLPPEKRKSSTEKAKEFEKFRMDEAEKLNNIIERGFRFEKAMIILQKSDNYNILRGLFEKFSYDMRDASNWLLLLNHFSEAIYGEKGSPGAKSKWNSSKYLTFLRDYAELKGRHGDKPDADIFRFLLKKKPYKNFSEVGIKRVWQRARDPKHNEFLAQSIERMELARPGCIEEWAAQKSISIDNARKDIGRKFADSIIERFKSAPSDT